MAMATPIYWSEPTLLWGGKPEKVLPMLQFRSFGARRESESCKVRGENWTVSHRVGKELLVEGGLTS